ncbi:TetR/AcrR family transcriptional regulator [Amycolatopsis sp. NBC_01480]|uniref:TetR/AcrR family transcriptional regulator n=1 Tax=Amycolatopsis sp. NBC_01480 TaxID=2903562 RepID=UPI002E298433|nr:helix-turn-helix domain-containing protein [Amycolatopsis sp. NBC_01480]
MAEEGKPLRADARLNQDRLLEAAARAFAKEGVGASLKAVAKDAGVGIGTLYRRFPTRETLVEATYRNEVARLCDSVPDLLETTNPADALRTWMDRFVAFMAAKHGMADTLKAVLTADGELRMRTRDLLTDALETLLSAGIAKGALRRDVDTNDVLMGLGGVTLIAGEPGQEALAGRLLNLLVDGLRYQAS